LHAHVACWKHRAVSIPRVFSDDALHEGAEIPATPAQAHHLGTVLRRGPGDAVRLFNPRDGEFEASIAALRKDRGAFVVAARRRPPVPEPPLALLVAALKRDALDLVVEKATELGATRILPVLTARTVASHSNTARLAAIARSAAEQCERLSVPLITDAAPLPAVLDAWDGTPLAVAAERRDAAPLPLVAGAMRALLVGPEGGFTPAELDDLARRPFVTPCKLGPRILRAETAAVAGLAVLAACNGDWSTEG
jgi:16S rRNA (uracil1498-N3)-methyltransferase